MVQGSQPIKVAIKYCGCCNPQIDLSRIARDINDTLAKNTKTVLVPYSEDTIDMVIILCGCPRACGNKEEVRARAKHHLLVAGENISGKAVREQQLTQSLHHELEAILSQSSA